MSEYKISKKVHKYKESSRDSNEDAISNYLDNHQGTTPSNGTKYVGVEIECYAKIGPVSLQKLFFKADLEEFVVIGDDSTIEPPNNGDPDSETDWHTFELRLLIPQNILTPTLKRFGRVFRAARLKTNESCGLHVHLDMRQRDRDDCYEKLKLFQDALFALVNKDRWNNWHCQRNEDDSRRDHHMGVNLMAWNEHRTIEVRMHHGCVDTNIIEKWVKLLLNVIDGKNVPRVRSKKDVMKWKGLSKKLRGYVNYNFKPEWFTEKARFQY